MIIKSIDKYKDLQINPEVLFRPEDDEYLLFLPEEHKIYTFPRNIFDIWVNISDISGSMKKEKLSEATLEMCVSFFINEGLIIEKKKKI